MNKLLIGLVALGSISSFANAGKCLDLEGSYTETLKKIRLGHTFESHYPEWKYEMIEGAIMIGNCADRIISKSKDNKYFAVEYLHESFLDDNTCVYKQVAATGLTVCLKD